MSDDMRPYVVRQGDYLVKLAWIHGFDVDEVWGHEKNKALADLRKDHHILAPGDVLYIPVKKKEGLPIEKGATNKYVAKVPKVEVTLVLRSDDALLSDEPGGGGPLADEEYAIEGLGSVVEGKTGVDGKISFSAPVTTREVKLSLKNYGVFDVRIGDMDPSSEITGVQKRLVGLGFHWDEPTGELDEDTRCAIQRFQRAHGLDMTGELTASTLDALEKAYGG